MLTFTLGTFAIALNHLLLISALVLATFVGWRVANRGLSQVWSDHEVVVDTGAVFQTRMVYIGNRRVIGYRNGASGVLQIAVEKP